MRKCYREIFSLLEEEIGFKIWLRGRIHSLRKVGKGIFLILRQEMHTIQCICFQNNIITEEMIKSMKSLTLESIIDILVEIFPSQNLLNTPTIKNLELSILEYQIVSVCATPLPFSIMDAMTDNTSPRSISLAIRLNYRWIDMRVPATQAIFRIRSEAALIFQRYLLSDNFIEVMTPKVTKVLESNSSNKWNPFTLPSNYQFTHSLLSDWSELVESFDRIFEIGTVISRKNANSYHLLAEYTGLDFLSRYENRYQFMQVTLMLHSS